MCFEEPSLCRKLVFRAQKCNNQIKKWFRSGGGGFCSRIYSKCNYMFA